MRQHACFTCALFLAFFSPLRISIAQPQANSLPVRFDKGRRIIVSGTVNGSIPVNMLIDTGSTCSVVSAQLAGRLHLGPMLEGVSVRWVDQLVRSSLVNVPSIELGPIRRPLAGLKAEIPLPGVDIVIGRDVLRTCVFTVDYKLRTLEFGPREALACQVRFDPSRPDVVVPARVGRREIALLLDSGADRLYLFEQMVRQWLRLDPARAEKCVLHRGIARPAVETVLPKVRLGNTEFDAIEAVVLQSLPGSESQRLDWHGLLGLAALKARRVQFDLEGGRFSWER